MSDHISSECARSLYKKAGTLTTEDPVSWKIPRNEHLLNDKVDLIVKEELLENPLPFELQEFQLLTRHCLGSLRNVILLAPTGSGKMICATYGIWVLQKVFGVGVGVRLMTLPLR